MLHQLNVKDAKRLKVVDTDSPDPDQLVSRSGSEVLAHGRMQKNTTVI
jgi:hypothetical protein